MDGQIASLNHDQVMESQTHLFHISKVVNFFSIRNKSGHDPVFLIIIKHIAHGFLCISSTKDIDNVRFSAHILLFSCHLEEIGQGDAMSHEVPMEVQEGHKLSNLCWVTEEMVFVEITVFNG